MTEAELAAGVRRARAVSWVASALMIGVLLFLLLGEEVDTWISRLVLFVGSGVVCGLSTYTAMRTASLRRQQRRLDRDEYRRLVSNQRLH